MDYSFLKKSKIWRYYRNGNTDIYINTINGTRIETTDDNSFNFAFPTSIDLTIQKRCNHGCSFCYLNCTDSGNYCGFNNPIFDQIMPYTEIAINLQEPFHPDLIPWLQKMKDRGVIVNGTINQDHLRNNREYIEQLLNEKLINGLGVSLVSCDDTLIEFAKQHNSVIIHVIAGIITDEEFTKLRGHNLKILILGYKDLGRGHVVLNDDNYNIGKKIIYLSGLLVSEYEELKNDFKCICFDNLAIKQLHIKDWLPQDTWDSGFCGIDGTQSFYINLVDKEFALNSLQKETHPMENLTLDEMFNIIKKEKSDI